MPTYTLAELSQRTLDSLDNNSALFPQANITPVLNHGLARLNIILGLQSSTVAVSGGTVAGQLQYTTPAGIQIPVRFDYQGLEIQKIGLERLARAFPNWASDSSANLGPPARVGVIDLMTFVLHPIDSFGGGTLEVTGINPITPMVNSGDVVGLEDQWAEALIQYSKMRLLSKLGGKPFADAVAAFKPFQEKIREESIWRDVLWSQFGLATKQKPGFQRMPV